MSTDNPTAPAAPEAPAADAAPAPAPAPPAAPPKPAVPMVRVLNKGTSDVIGIADRRTHHIPPGGENQVPHELPAALWAKLKKHPAIAYMLEEHDEPNPHHDESDPESPETIHIPAVLEVLG